MNSTIEAPPKKPDQPVRPPSAYPLQTSYRLPPVQSVSPPAPQQYERTTDFGRSLRGQPLRVHIFGDAPNPVFIFGGIHGDEYNSYEVARKLVEYMRTNPAIWQSRSVAIMPAANPDGLAYAARGNANNVDLNRNFPARNWRSGAKHGRAAGSEPETQALIKAVQALRPSSIISLHSISGGRQCNNYDGPAGDLARLMARYNGYPAISDIGYSTPGSFGTWAGGDLGIPTITLEMPKSVSGEEGWRTNRDALLSAVRDDAGLLARQRAAPQPALGR